ncbi:MAG: hydantoinase/oxoprolinase family protein [Alphaproteobacteria bacterium]|nr:hydantoinase/oxoprolinase family protein [Alphaproteobacteria bacterium]
MSAAIRIAADIGGTFTDIAVTLPDGTIATHKVLSTPADYAAAVVDGVRDLLASRGVKGADVSEVLHACTVATNSILEGKGARTALVTTRGFRDVLELRRVRVPKLYDPLWIKPPPLVPRDRRFEVTERVGHDGEVITPLDEADLDRAIAAIGKAKVEAIAVCFLHSYANPDHERRVGARLRAAFPEAFVTLSVDILPEIREYERTSTTVVNAYVGPSVKAYVGALAKRLARDGVAGRLMVMQSSGGILDAPTVMEQPARIVECGPAAGVIGAARVAAAAGMTDVLTLDMGGTTAKASLIEAGKIAHTDEYEVGGGISLSSRLVKGAGYALKLPVIDISEVGAGGGSLVRFDRGGGLKVGPESAGAVPGPACYGLGGVEPTVTDANVILGFVNPKALAGGTVPIDAGKARSVIEEKVARRLGTSIEAAAWSVFEVASSTMIRALKAVSTYRGRDPREFGLVAFGGNGGVFGPHLAKELGIARVIVPPAAGVLSAIGLLVSDVAFGRSHGYLRRTLDATPADVGRLLDGLAEEVLAKLGSWRATATLTRIASMRYTSQAFELPVGIPDGPVTAAVLAALPARFEAEHQSTYGHNFRGTVPTEIVALSVTATAPAGGSAETLRVSSGRGEAAELTRAAYFGPRHGRIATPVLGRAALSSAPRPGPLIVEEYEGTTVVPPGAAASRDAIGNIRITFSGN